MKKENTHIAAVVVTYNGEAWIGKCLASLAQSTIPVNVLVVDNASPDATPAIVKEQFPAVTIIETGANLGFGRANNIGLQWAVSQQADYVLLLNQDAWIAPDAIGKMIRVLEEHPGYGVISPYHLNYTGSGPETYFNDFVLQHYTPRLQADMVAGRLEPIYETSFVHAACWLLPAETVKKVGGFDPLFFHYGEDNDYVQRLKYKKLQIGIVPAAIVYHYGTNASMDNPLQDYRFQLNQSLLQLKNPAAGTLGAGWLFVKRLAGMLAGKGTPARRKAYMSNFRRFFQIYRSRAIQQKEFAYLT
ncbi:MAG: glycosyltransferase family 2 protein [Ferruginibacter sp.]